MMLIHLLGGAVVVVLTVVAAVAYVVRRPPAQLATLAGWAVGLLIVQAATGMFLLTATEEGPGPLHIALPLVGLAIAGIARFSRPERSSGRDALLGAAFSIAAIGAAVALVTGLTTG
jgi:hypothetical protein